MKVNYDARTGDFIKITKGKFATTYVVVNSFPNSVDLKQNGKTNVINLQYAKLKEFQSEFVEVEGGIESYSNTPYLKPSSDKKPEKIGNYRI